MASAQDNQGIVNQHRRYEPNAETGWNGHKVFLSSPRHDDSGDRGECGLTDGRGWEENVNGREWNRYAATGQYYLDVYNPVGPGRNFRSRGYKVTVGANLRDEGHLRNLRSSNNWNSTVHIVSHTNAAEGRCQSAQYTLGMWASGDARGERLARRLSFHVGVRSPGNVSNLCAGSGCTFPLWDELTANARWRAYMELVFHTNIGSQEWMRGTGNADRGAQRYSWRYGRGVDTALGFPR